MIILMGKTLSSPCFNTVYSDNIGVHDFRSPHGPGLSLFQNLVAVKAIKGMLLTRKDGTFHQ